jgi:fucose permease
MSIVGGAVLTPLMGLISQMPAVANGRIPGIAVAYTIPLAGYVVVAAYSLLWPRLAHHTPRSLSS